MTHLNIQISPHLKNLRDTYVCFHTDYSRVIFMENWYLACHKTGKQNAFKAQMFLAHLNVAVFIPQIYSYRARADRPGQFKRSMEPLFPGYMFICFDPETIHTSKIAKCPGVNYLVRFSNTIIPVNDAVIEEIMRLPICAYSPPYIQPKKEALYIRKSASSILTDEQREFIKGIADERDGDIRNALFYAFTENAFCQFMEKQSGW